jgi:hypothetical protein
MKLAILPLTPDLWPALEDLFGKWGASNGCWCMYWRILFLCAQGLSRARGHVAGYRCGLEDRKTREGFCF